MRLDDFLLRNYVSCVMFFIITQAGVLSAAETSVESGVSARFEYNDNLFLTSDTQESVSSMVVTPNVQLLTEDDNWEAFLSLKLKSSLYSEDAYNATDQFYEAAAKYESERNVYAVNAEYSLDSNLNSESDAFGVVGYKVDESRWSITPEYTRLLTERLSLALTYNYTESDFDDIANNVSYQTNTVMGKATYNLSERSEFNFLLISTDYESKDGIYEYQIFNSMIGLTHKFDETLTIDYSIGSTSIGSNTFNTQAIDFFGQTVVASQVVDSNDTGFVFDVGVDVGWLTARASKSTSTDSFGRVNDTDEIDLYFRYQMTELVRLVFRANYSDIEQLGDSISVGSYDRTIAFYEPILKVRLAKNLNVIASYRYTVDDYVDTQTSNSSSQDSNILYVGVSYDFPSLPVF
ncbi:MAG: hypothetical protein OQK69_07305 [Gammaproteobacteria bacterium]|nr:hypothetical protein [Gammaproteobacteria bacterium]